MILPNPDPTEFLEIFSFNIKGFGLWSKNYYRFFCSKLFIPIPLSFTEI